MRNKILKLAFRFSAFAFAVGMTGCDALDLAPIDTYGSGNFWTRKEHVIYNPQNEAFAIPKRSVPIFGPLSKTKCLIFYKIRTAFRWTSNPI